MQSTVMLSLAELASIALDKDLVALLVQLAETLQAATQPTPVTGPRKQIDAHLCFCAAAHSYQRRPSG